MAFSMDDPRVGKILQALKASKDGLRLKELEEKTGIPYRVLHNLTWRLEGSPRDGSLAHPDQRKITRTNTGAGVVYALTAPGQPRMVFTRSKPDIGHTYATRAQAKTA